MLNDFDFKTDFDFKNVFETFYFCEYDVQHLVRKCYMKNWHCPGAFHPHSTVHTGLDTYILAWQY